jgi:hypothetical protein
VVTQETIVAGDESVTIISEQPALIATESTMLVADYSAPYSLTYHTSGMNDPVFFQADLQHFQPLPAQARYLDSKERERSMQYAASPSWTFAAASADEAWMKPLSVQMAYFDRLDRQRTSLASSSSSADIVIADSSTLY